VKKSKIQKGIHRMLPFVLEEEKKKTSKSNTKDKPENNKIGYLQRLGRRKKVEGIQKGIIVI
jgi:hypothetical protein